MSPRELSGITPSGPLTLGNHLGALRRFRERQDDGFYFVADLHALTTPHDPERLRQLTLSTAALFLAAGLDPDRATVFVQSDVAAHVDLAYLLECTAHVGELSRMIQFKEKGGRPGTRASLFTYPCLMAADILLYRAQDVPVGGDQSQHVELARDLAVRFNAAYCDTFVVPGLVPSALAARVRDLAEPSRKMSKSAPLDAPGVIRILDDAETIRRKIRRAVTDGDGELRYDPVTKPGVANLAEITATILGTTPQQVLDGCAGYRDLKDACAEAVIAELEPVRQRHDELIADGAELRDVLTRGAERARVVAEVTLVRARQAIGLIGASGVPGTSRVVPLTTADTPEVLTLQRAAFVTEARAHDDPHLPPLCQTLDELAAELASTSVIGLGMRDARGRLVGSGRVHVGDDGTARIARLCVAPDQQGRGLGQTLLAELSNRVPASVGELRLDTGEHSSRNLRLYGRAGFVETGRVATGRGYDLVLMAKPVGSGKVGELPVELADRDVPADVERRDDDRVRLGGGGQPV